MYTKEIKKDAMSIRQRAEERADRFMAFYSKSGIAFLKTFVDFLTHERAVELELQLIKELNL